MSFQQLKISREVLQTTATDAHTCKQTMQRMQLLLYIAVRRSLQHQLLICIDRVQATAGHAVKVA
jgi:hypothetical protein